MLLTSHLSFPTGTLITGELTQQATQPITVEIFYSPSCDPSGFGEGRTLIATRLVNPGTRVPFSATDRFIRIGGVYTATATTVDGTSEFSRCLP